ERNPEPALLAAMSSPPKRTSPSTMKGLPSVGLTRRMQPVAAQGLLPNGSFEDGDPPAAWRAYPGGSLTKGDAHRGGRCVSGVARRRSVVWQSDSAGINPQTDYRLEGWIRCPKGEGQLETELTSAVGTLLRRLATP